MRAVDIIIRKRDGGILDRDEIAYFVEGFCRGDIPDYQAAAWAIAVLLRGMNSRETADLTDAMVATGKVLDLSSLLSNSVDKHSTGGVGDKTTLVVQPIVAACGVPIGKMSGRGLGFSGGTLDKMESIPGFTSEMDTEAFIDQLKRIGMVLSSQTPDMVPADGKLYALRDVTGTVPSIPLIASSVMSKKIAAGAQAIVLDVKVGVGAFMQTVEEALELAELMIEIVRHVDRRVVALISDMNQPLGFAVGNALEVKEAIDSMIGKGPADFLEHCLEVAGHLLLLAGVATDLEDAMRRAEESIRDGRALEKFKLLVSTQGGDVSFVEQPDRLPTASLIETVGSSQSGFVRGVHAREVGLTAMMLGGGRTRKRDKIDYSVGVVVHRKVGDQVNRGDPLFTVHANSETQREAAIRRLTKAIQMSESPVEPIPLIYHTIGT